MTAEIISYSADPWDTRLSLKVECLTCQYEWGWTSDSKTSLKMLQQMADFHNAEHHSRPTEGNS